MPRSGAEPLPGARNRGSSPDRTRGARQSAETGAHRALVNRMPDHVAHIHYRFRHAVPATLTSRLRARQRPGCTEFDRFVVNGALCSATVTMPESGCTPRTKSPDCGCRSPGRVGSARGKRLGRGGIAEPGPGAPIDQSEAGTRNYPPGLSGPFRSGIGRAPARTGRRTPMVLPKAGGSVALPRGSAVPDRVHGTCLTAPLSADVAIAA